MLRQYLTSFFSNLDYYLSFDTLFHKNVLLKSHKMFCRGLYMIKIAGNVHFPLVHFLTFMISNCITLAYPLHVSLAYPPCCITRHIPGVSPWQQWLRIMLSFPETGVKCSLVLQLCDPAISSLFWVISVIIPRRLTDFTELISPTPPYHQPAVSSASLYHQPARSRSANWVTSQVSLPLTLRWLLVNNLCSKD